MESVEEMSGGIRKYSKSFAAELSLLHAIFELGGNSDSEVLTSVHLNLSRARLKHSGNIVLWFLDIVIFIRIRGGKCVFQIMKTTKPKFTLESKVKSFSEYLFVGR